MDYKMIHKWSKMDHFQSWDPDITNMYTWIRMQNMPDVAMQSGSELLR